MWYTKHNYRLLLVKVGLFMGGLIILFIIWRMFKTMKPDQQFSDIGKAIAIFFLICSLLAALSSPLTWLILIGFGIYWFIKKTEKEQVDMRSKQYKWDSETVRDVKSNKKVDEEKYNEYKNPTSVTSKILPKPIGKRKKIIKAFSEKYNLRLTDEQIKCIAEASYMSLAWKQEVEMMAQKYDAVHQWFNGNTAYLRAYLYAFPVQDVSSDFKQQFQICIYSFEEVFNYSDTMPELSVQERIERINSKFFTNFDDVTYMIAYRFLEKLGKKHQLETVELARNDSELDELLEKYKAAEEAEGQV